MYARMHARTYHMCVYAPNIRMFAHMHSVCILSPILQVQEFDLASMANRQQGRNEEFEEGGASPDTDEWVLLPPNLTSS